MVSPLTVSEDKNESCTSTRNECIHQGIPVSSILGIDDIIKRNVSDAEKSIKWAFGDLRVLKLCTGKIFKVCYPLATHPSHPWRIT